MEVMKINDELLRQISDSDHRPVLKELTLSLGEEVAVRAIKTAMPMILAHYVECTWGACYSAKFEELIQPHFDDPELLDRFLRTSAIKPKGAIVGRTGACIFDELLAKLRRCNSRAVREYLNREFGA